MMDRDNNREYENYIKVTKDKEKYLDKIKGSLFGGAVGDALGYAVEFDREEEIFSAYGNDGIQEYKLDPHTGKALICFLQVQIPEICRQKWRILHLRFGESCRLPGRIA